MRIVRCEDLTENELEAIRASRPALLVGSAVSIFGPTSLPNGKWVTDDLLKWLASSEGMAQSWPKWLIADAKQLPFEALWEAYPDQEKLPAIICRMYGNIHVEPNALHSAIARGVAEGVFSSLITTNYDLAFDNYFAKQKVPACTIVSEKEGTDWMKGGALTAPYWKIHGTARIEYKQTIVANLALERRMDDWKRKLLGRLVEGRTVIFLGYSGRDFDICPELTCLKESFDAVWLAQAPKEGQSLEPNANRSRIIAKKPTGRVVLGDLYDFLGKLCGISIERGEPLSAPVNRDCFDASLLMEWRVRLLERMACPHISLPLLRSLPGPQSIDRRLRESKMLHNEGSGRKAVRLADAAISDANENHEKLDCLLEASTGWWVYGSGRKSRARLRSARRLALSTESTPAQQGKMAEAELLQWVMRYRFLRLIGTLRRCIQARGREYYLEASAAYEISDLDGLYSVHHDAERMGIAVQDGFASAADLGFQALGLRILQSQKERDRIMDLPTRLTLADLRSCYVWWRRAERYGWKPESWKWAWILIWYGGTWRHWQLWGSWLSNFRKTQYPLLGRTFFFFDYLARGLSATIRRLLAPPM